MAIARFALFIAPLAMAALAACASAPASTDVSFAPVKPMSVRASSIEVQKAPGAESPSATLDFTPPVALVDLPQDWAKARLSAVGGPGKVTILITEARVEDRPLPHKQGLSGLFSFEPTEEFEARLAVRVTFQDGDGFAAASASVKASATVPEHSSNAERQAIYAKLMQDVAEALDRELSGQVRDHFPYRAFAAP
ncbi:MAG: hypothetical protein H6923_00715 [Alphaproteobacteria bacterium]|nr:hypothetical protein [Alphaproteobacteria bacterium]